jgi:hypothetical protein
MLLQVSHRNKCLACARSFEVVFLVFELRSEFDQYGHTRLHDDHEYMVHYICVRRMDRDLKVGGSPRIFATINERHCSPVSARIDHATFKRRVKQNISQASKNLPSCIDLDAINELNATGLEDMKKHGLSRATSAGHAPQHEREGSKSLSLEPADVIISVTQSVPIFLIQDKAA